MEKILFILTIIIIAANLLVNISFGQGVIEYQHYLRLSQFSMFTDIMAFVFIIIIMKIYIKLMKTSPNLNKEDKIRYELKMDRHIESYGYVYVSAVIMIFCTQLGVAYPVQLFTIFALFVSVKRLNEVVKA